MLRFHVFERYTFSGKGNAISSLWKRYLKWREKIPRKRLKIASVTSPEVCGLCIFCLLDLRNFYNTFCKRRRRIFIVTNTSKTWYPKLDCFVFFLKLFSIKFDQIGTDSNNGSVAKSSGM